GRNLGMRFFGIHSNSTENVHLMLGNGGADRAEAPGASVLKRLRTALPSYVSGITYASCNDARDAEVNLLYCKGVEDDTQARLMNGDTSRPFSVDGPACTEAPPSGDGYITFEMRVEARDKIPDIIQAVLSVYPPDLPGTG